MTKAMDRSRNRPLQLTQEIAEEIFDRLAEGEMLFQICADVTMPTRETLHSWVREDKEFAGLYAIAMKCHVQIIFKDILDIADDTSEDWIYSVGRRDGTIRCTFNHSALRRAELRISERWRYVDELFATEPVRLTME